MPDSLSPSLVVRLFGSFQVSVRGQLLPPLRSRKGYRLLALLVLRGGAEVERSWLAGTLWNEGSEASALSALRNSLTDLRRALGPEASKLLTATHRTLRLDLRGAEVDVLEFDAAVARGDSTSLRHAVELHRAPLLEGWVEAWAFQEQQVRQEQYLAALQTLATQAMDESNPAAAIRYLRLAIRAESTRESLYRALMQALGAQGDYAAVTQCYRDLRLWLQQEFRTEPAAETRALYEQLLKAARRPTAPRPLIPAPAGQLPVAAGLPTTVLFLDFNSEPHDAEQPGPEQEHLLLGYGTGLRAIIEAAGGQLQKTGGGGVYASFAEAADAVVAALHVQEFLHTSPLGDDGPVSFRMVLHTDRAAEQEASARGMEGDFLPQLATMSQPGQILLTAATAERVRDLLPAGASLHALGQHPLHDPERPEPLFLLVPSEPPVHALAPQPRSASLHQLPTPVTSFVGREREVEAVGRLLTATRLLTLTGPGGVGKTRLALEVAARVAGDFPAGVAFVSLVPLTDPELVWPTVAQRLGLQGGAGRPVMERLKEHLQRQQRLLLLDSFEQVAAAAPGIAELLAGCPGLKVMVTSQAVLHLLGEHEYAVPPLQVPEMHPPRPVEEFLQFPAVRLFLQRARSVKPDFALTGDNAPLIAAICRRLDGLPLAIELAAARTKLLPPPALLARLENRLQLLTGGARDLPARQQTLRGAIAWSYDLLEEADMALFRRLSVFVGGCSLEAAEAIGHGMGDRNGDVLDRIAALMDQSLLRQEETPAGEPRLSMLETIREYGQERLEASGEAERVRQQHGEFFLARCEAITQEDWLVSEQDNLRAALGFFIASGQVEPAVRVEMALFQFWLRCGFWTEGRERLTELLSRPETQAHPRPRALLLRHQGRLAWLQGDYPTARAALEESIALLRQQQRSEGLPASLNALGEVARTQGDYPTAQALFEESLAILSREDEPGNMAHVFVALGEVVYEQGDPGAPMLFAKSLTLFREVGDPHGIAVALSCLCDVALTEGDPERARSLHEESLLLRRELGLKGEIARTVSSLGRVATYRGDYAQAHGCYTESLRLVRELGNRPAMATCLEGLACLAATVDQGAQNPGAASEAGQAAQLFGAAQALREAIGAPLPPVHRAEHERNVAAVRGMLGEAAFAAAWAEGRDQMQAKLKDGDCWLPQLAAGEGFGPSP
jgi:predicted ATPase/DNA-binding SARP family transcriptional activator